MLMEKSDFPEILSFKLYKILSNIIEIISMKFIYPGKSIK